MKLLMDKVSCPECLESGRVFHIEWVSHQHKSNIVLDLCDGYVSVDFGSQEEYDKFNNSPDYEYQCFSCWAELDEGDIVEHNKRLLLISSLSGLAADSEKVVK